MKIVLVGYMGSGKTTIGKELAKELNLSFLDLDSYIEETLNKTISDIFLEKGEIFFRKKEYELLKKLLDEKNDFVLSTGGGTPCYSGNMEVINESDAYSIYLKLSIGSLINRLSSEKENRPLIKNLSNEQLPEFIGKHLFERSNYYSKANTTLVCDGKSPLSIVTEIKGKLV